MENNIIATSARSPKGRSWGLERRLQFIDFRLRWEGRINRTDLTSFFGLSIPQASLDIAKYQEIAPDNLIYDRRTKTYMPSPAFSPVYPQSSAQRYLAELLAIETGALDQDSSFIDTSPAVDWVRVPDRIVDEQIVETLVRAIRGKLALHIRYQSTSSTDDPLRQISPHALGHDGFRWYVRAFCHARRQFCDLILTRILCIDSAEHSSIDACEDRYWHQILQLSFAPNPKLSPAHQRALELDYEMDEGEIAVHCRQAFLRYTLERFNLPDKENRDAGCLLILKNRAEIQPYIDMLPPKAECAS